MQKRATEHPHAGTNQSRGLAELTRGRGGSEIGKEAKETVWPLGRALGTAMWSQAWHCPYVILGKTLPVCVTGFV